MPSSHFTTVPNSDTGCSTHWSQYWLAAVLHSTQALAIWISQKGFLLALEVSAHQRIGKTGPGHWLRCSFPTPSKFAFCVAPCWSCLSACQLTNLYLPRRQLPAELCSARNVSLDPKQALNLCCPVAYSYLSSKERI